MYVPDDTPEACPACGDPYGSVSRHAGGFTVNLLDNRRYRRVCFHPSRTADGNPALDCYHHTHAEATEDEPAEAAEDEPAEGTEDGTDPPATVPAERS